MLGRIIVPAMIGVAALAAAAPTAASAQTFGVYVGNGYPVYDRYDGRRYGYPADYDDRRAAWLARQRWEQQQRWEQEEARRRYWQREQWEHHRDWHGHDDDDE